MPRSWLGWLNFLLLQWAWVRLARVEDDEGGTCWAWLLGVVPLTGWWSDYRWVRARSR